MTQEEIIGIANTSPALKEISDNYPPNRYGRVPLKVKMAATVDSDLPEFIQPIITAHKDQEYYVWCNSHGAMSAILPNGEKLGIKPSECLVIEWHNNTSKS